MFSFTIIPILLQKVIIQFYRIKKLDNIIFNILNNEEKIDFKY